MGGNWIVPIGFESCRLARAYWIALIGFGSRLLDRAHWISQLAGLPASQQPASQPVRWQFDGHLIAMRCN